MGTPGGRLTLFCLRTWGEGGCINDALQLPVGFVMATPEARGVPRRRRAALLRMGCGICGAQYKKNIRGPCSKMMKNFKRVAAERWSNHEAFWVEAWASWSEASRALLSDRTWLRSSLVSSCLSAVQKAIFTWVNFKDLLALFMHLWTRQLSCLADRKGLRGAIQSQRLL